ncbi:hypothetical protein ACFFRR_011544 [Megaselia abdita]
MIFKFAIKTSLAVGAVYYVKPVWGNSIETEKLYNNTKTTLCPHVKKITKSIPYELPALPSSGQVGFVTKHYYNEGVKNSIRFVHMLPCYAGRAIKSAKDALQSASNPTATPAPASTPKA